MKRSSPMKRTGFKPSAPPRRPERQMERYTPKPRAVAPSAGLALALAAAPTIDVPEGEPTSAAGARYMGLVAQLGCRLCRRLGYGATPGEVHHLDAGRGGWGRASDFLTMSLCPEHHRGTTGVHGDRSALRQAGVTELDLLADTIAELAETT